MGEFDGHKTHSQQQQHNPIFAVGSEVEVSIDEEGFKGAWFRATILRLPTCSPPSKKKKAVIQYKTLVTEDGSGQLKEHADILSLRPAPPEIVGIDFEEGDIVDADDKDGWWTGVVVKVLENSTYSVFFENPPHVIDFERKELRLHQDWVEGKWVRSQKMRTREHVDGVGELDKQGARSVDGNGGNTLGQSLKTRVTDKKGKDEFDALKITPKEVGTKKESGMNDPLVSEEKRMAGSPANCRLQLLSEVDQKLKLAGAAEKCSNDQAKENGMAPEQQQASSGNSHKRKRGRPRKLVLAPKAIDKQQNGDGGNTDKVVAKGCVNDFQVVHRRNVNELPQCKTRGVENNSVSSNVDDDDRPLLTWFGEKPCLASINASRRTPCTTAKERTKESEKVNDEKERSVVEGPIDAATVDNDGWPFVKNSPVWKAIDSLEVFRLIPQMPHFRPLSTYKEECREGLAIGSMVTFASLVEKISKLQYDDPRDVFESTLESLFDLERHGFDISILCKRVNELLSIKVKQDQYQDETREAEKNIVEQIQEKKLLAEEIETIEQKIAELQRKHAAVKLETEIKDHEIKRLQSLMETVRETSKHASLDFKLLAALPLKRV